MGYKIKIQSGSITIPKENQAKILEIWKELNDPKHDSKKNGGSYHGEFKYQAWYSWMTHDYDKTCNTCEDVLDMMGFDFNILENGDIEVYYYNSKRGQEQEFFNPISSLIYGKLCWIGEDDEEWEWNFTSYTQTK